MFKTLSQSLNLIKKNSQFYKAWKLRYYALKIVLQIARSKWADDKMGCGQDSWNQHGGKRETKVNCEEEKDIAWLVPQIV